ncbi:tRNA pseudouridine(13) synthase TruD [Vibrio sp. SS-MA-C1-2]|uniref:tRNA pseudouridine(13) synthase TruD n=1 Tax=Vibrio sp. SS-MA-C1-2 TaxID=2908646 RepID=UPI001F1DB467|nr:tRNA pseudouridine(13) synthase TruD [Vibrio sp. SS-MA-C1-2]UJF19020.1 tRNA pseudouridine(13) synthase TruD [Vibrio sp. SS-MA-C1-2]
MTISFDNFAFMLGKPVAAGLIKQLPEHFVVKEQLGFEFANRGEHFMVKIRKVGENTKYVVNELGKFCGVKSRDVSWAGLKDRHAVTEQWLSVHLPGKDDPDLTEFVATHPGIEVLETARHDKKLRPGDLVGNSFELHLTQVDKIEDIIQRVEQVKERGVPNYFGEQRFGHQGNNVVQARRWGSKEINIRDKSKRSFYLSAARSWIFNQILSQRLTDDTVEQVLLGDLLQSETDHRGTLATAENLDCLQTQVNNNTADITGPLTGDNQLPTKDDAEKLELSIIEQEPELLALIRDNRMRQERRELLLQLQELSWTQHGDDCLQLNFSLPAGSFATSVVRELMLIKETEE